MLQRYLCRESSAVLRSKNRLLFDKSFCYFLATKSKRNRLIDKFKIKRRQQHPASSSANTSRSFAFFLSFVPPKERKPKKSSRLGGSLTQHQLIPLHQKNSSRHCFSALSFLFTKPASVFPSQTQTVFDASASFVGWVPSCAANAARQQSIVSSQFKKVNE